MSKFIRILPPVAPLNGLQPIEGAPPITFSAFIEAILTGAASEPRPDMLSIISFGRRFRKAVEADAKVVEVHDTEFATLDTAARAGLGLTPVGRMSCGDYLEEIVYAPNSEEAAIKRGA